MTPRPFVILTVCVASLLANSAAKAQTTTPTTTQPPPPIVFYKPEHFDDDDSTKLRLTMDLSPEYFIWEESSDGVTVRETGPRIQLGILIRQVKDKGWLFGAMLRPYYGNVQYNGFDQVLNTNNNTIALVPATARTEYIGGLFEAQALYKCALTARYTGSFKGALGADIWDRNLMGTGGYHELWTVAYARGGYEVAPCADKGLLGDVGFKVPFYIANTALDVTIRPQTRPSAYAEAGYQFNSRFAVTGYFDSYWFGKSPVVSDVFQPESKQYQIGLRLKWSFE